MNELLKRSRVNGWITANRFAMALLLSGGLALGLLGCESKSGVAKEPIVTKQIGASQTKAAEEKATPSATPTQSDNAPQTEKAPQTEPVVLAEKPGRMPYNPIGKVDPFAPLYKEETEKKPEAVVAKPKKPERPRTPLEKLDLGQLKLTAVVTTREQKRALVEEASGKGYVIEVGTRIGLERGAVVAIEDNRIVIEHQAEDDFGKATSRKRELKLQKPPGD